ncbi:MAG: tRNA pseudouridine(13) synthase TruD [bacterium]
MKIKCIPEDFIVEEIVNYQNLIAPKGNMALFKITKKNINTLFAIQKIYNVLHLHKIKPKINFWGLKDKYSLSTQFILIQHNQIQQIIEILSKTNFKNMQVEFISFIKSKISSDHIRGNKFRITIRDIDKRELPEFIENLKKISKISVFLNYYDSQRISIVYYKPSFKNLQELKDFLDGFEYTVKRSKESYTKRFYFTTEREQNIKLAVDFNLQLCKKVIHLVEKLRINTRLRFYHKNNVMVVPILDEGFEKIIYEIRNRNYQGRTLTCSIDQFKYEISDDELSSNRVKIVLEFVLGRGCFATVLVKHLIPLKMYSHVGQKWETIQIFGN